MQNISFTKINKYIYLFQDNLIVIIQWFFIRIIDLIIQSTPTRSQMVHKWLNLWINSSEIKKWQIYHYFINQFVQILISEPTLPIIVPVFSSIKTYICRKFKELSLLKFSIYGVLQSILSKAIYLNILWSLS